jgi:hypothetical protein
MKLFSHPTVVDGQNESKNQAYRQQRSPNYLVVLIYIYFKKCLFEGWW